MLHRRENWGSTGSADETRPVSAHRFGLGVDVGILSDHGQMRGSVQNMSVSGARIEGSGIRPPEGEDLRLGFAFHAEALPVPIRARVVRHTETGGFAVEFQNVDFRTQILLRALLPRVSESDLEYENERNTGRICVDTDLDPELYAACVRKAEKSGLSLSAWIQEQLERAAVDPH